MIIILDKQIHVYSLDTSDFYNPEESKIHKHLNKLYAHRKLLKKLNKKNKESEKTKYLKKHITKTNKRITILKEKLYKQFEKNVEVRILHRSKLKSKKIVSVFESTLTRIMESPINLLTKDILIVQTYFFDVIEDIILDGFVLDGEKYVCFTASAGQIRTKKTVFIKLSVLIKYQHTLMCGLSIEDINKLGGVNINKFLAYLALNNSATDIWEGFDINKTIVVDDLETTVKGLVDFIDDKTYKITRKTMKIPINHTDGAGMILSSVNKKNFMTRLPWIKGLLVSFDYIRFIKENNLSGIIKDIYGKEHDIVKEGIEVIFTKGQFKMWKYYSSWKEYCDKFIQYNCQAGKCNEEEDYFEDAKLNYQMIQTLTDMTDDEIFKITENTRNNIRDIAAKKEAMLKLLGVTRANYNKNYLQQALEIYPELLKDSYCKDIVTQVKKSLVKEGKSGKLHIKGKYTFIAPDMYAFCEYLFMNNKNPKGLLQNGEIFCNLYKENKKLDCLRSPHLYREHAIRNNVIDDKKAYWFTTSALYVSSHDLISKIIMNDWDGDKSLVCADETFIKVAERNMKDIVPLYYNMAKAGAITISNEIIFNGLKLAYTGGNIGPISNDITKIWNSENVSLEAIKLLCMENNFVIDYAKTLYKPERPKDKHKLITSYTKSKTPYFFMFAKDKNKKDVEVINNSTMNRISKLINDFQSKLKLTGMKRFNCKMLQNYKNPELDVDIIHLYEKLDLKKFTMMNNKKDVDNYTYIYQDIRNQLLQVNFDASYVTDCLIEYLYNIKKAKNKTTLWECFGDIIVKNLKRNIDDKNIYCDECGDLIEQKANYQKYCDECAKEIEKKNSKNRFKKWYQNKKSNEDKK